MSRQKALGILLAILVFAALLRFYRLDQHDVITDEVFYGYRSIGLIDSLNSPFQPTTFEWFEQVPGWAGLSFHDHPPLGFWIQHLFFKVFGTNLWGLRLPFVLAGLGAIIFLYLIVRRLFQSETPALWAAGILAVSQNHVWISRIGLQESLVIFFLLLAVWTFVKALERKTYFYPMVAALGAAILMKYTSVVLLPIFVLYAVWKQRTMLTARRLIFGSLLLLAILSPVLLYNFKLYQARGHFDFQISFLLKQDVADWQERPGREVGSFPQKFIGLFTRFFDYYGVIFSAAALFAVFYLCRRWKDPPVQFLALGLLFTALLLLVVGPQERFLAMLAPYLAAILGTAIFTLGSRHRKVFYLAGGFLLLELLFAVNTNHLVNPAGREGLHYALTRRESELWGYNQLEDQFVRLTEGRYPAQTFPLRFEFAGRLQTRGIERAKQKGLAPAAVLFIADSRLHGPSHLWYLTRHTVYEGWPIIDDATYLNAVKDDPDFFAKQGFREYVFFKAENTVLRPDRDGQASEAMTRYAAEKGAVPRFLDNPRGSVAFSVYNF